MNEIFQRIIHKAIDDLISHGVDLQLTTEKLELYKNMTCNGYYMSSIDGSVPILKCKYTPRGNTWFEIFIHEYCHFRQDIECDKTAIAFNSYNTLSSFDGWVMGKEELSAVQVSNCVRLIQDLELNCEKRVVKLIKKYELPIDIKNYIQRANSYVLFYKYVEKHRTWFKEKAPYRIVSVLNQLPTTWLNNYSVLSVKYEQEVTRHLKKELGKKNEI